MIASFANLSLDRPHIMGIVNVTPDSFSDGGMHNSLEQAVAHARTLLLDGATILDIGGESTRPGSDPVPLDAELDRVIPVIEKLAADMPETARISIDTRKADVMRAAILAGAQIINDVSALTFDDKSLETAAGLQVPVILMHAQGDPKTMQDSPQYEDVVAEVSEYLAARAAACVAAGIDPETIAIDPGIGFGKTLDHNLQLMSGLSALHAHGYPVLLGASRKRFIGTLTGQVNAHERVSGSVATALHGLSQGVRLFRVHDVRETADAFAVWQAISHAEE